MRGHLPRGPDNRRSPITWTAAAARTWDGGAMNEIAAKLGEVGLPAPVSELAARDWDAIIVGGGHNGLTAAAYLARAGRSVLVLERRERLGGACTLERPFADERFVISPCAYVLGLLDQLVIDDLDLHRRGLRWWIADPNLWIPFADGSSLGQFVDDSRTQANLEELGRLEGRHRRLLEAPAALRRHPQAAAQGRARRVGGGDAHPRRDRGDARRQPGDDRPRLRGLDRRGDGRLLPRPAPSRRLLRRRRDRHLGRSPRPGHGVGEADAPPGRPRRRRLELGLRRGRDGHGLLRDRRRGPRGRRGARLRRAGGVDHARGGGRARGRDQDPARAS